MFRQLEQAYIEKVSKHIKDFSYAPALDVHELAYYDDTIYKKVKDPALYEEVLNMNLDKIEGKSIYGGEDIRVYKSKKNGHYVYLTLTWGD